MKKDLIYEPKKLKELSKKLEERVEKKKNSSSFFQKVKNLIFK